MSLYFLGFSFLIKIKGHRALDNLLVQSPHLANVKSETRTVAVTDPGSHGTLCRVKGRIEGRESGDCRLQRLAAVSQEPLCESERAGKCGVEKNVQGDPLQPPDQF